jgi:hypothetical protein
MKKTMMTVGVGLALLLTVSAHGGREFQDQPAGAEDKGQAKAAKKVLEFGQAGCAVTFLAFSSDGRRAAYALWPFPDKRNSVKGAAVVWDLAAGKEVRRLSVTAGPGTLSPDGKTLALRVENSGVKLFDADSGKELIECESSRHSACPSQFAFLPDGRTLAGCFWRTDLILWDTATGKVVRRFGVARGGIESFALSADGKHVLAEHFDSRQEVYDPMKHGKQLPRDGMVQITDVTQRLWEVDTGKEVCRLAEMQTSFHPRLVGTWGACSALGGTYEQGYRVRISPAGRPFFTPAPAAPPCLVRTNGRDNAVYLVELATGKELCHLKEAGEGRADLAVFGPDGHGLGLVMQNYKPPEANQAVIFDLSALLDQQRQHAAKLSREELNALWEDLAGGAKARTAYHLIRSLPRPAALAFFKERVPQIKVVGAAEISGWIADLDHEKFAIRDKAQSELRKLGADAEAALRQCLAAKPPLEKARRVEQLLEEMKSQWITPDTMRGLWLIELLEQQATPEASALLTLLAKGPRGAWVTEEAGASLKRLEAGQK